jgi:hypothetical protein
VRDAEQKIAPAGIPPHHLRPTVLHDTIAASQASTFTGAHAVDEPSSSHSGIRNRGYPRYRLPSTSREAYMQDDDSAWGVGGRTMMERVRRICEYREECRSTTLT